MSEQLLYFNGINGTTGTYGLPPMTAKELSSLITGQAEPEDMAEIRRRMLDAQAKAGVMEGLDPTDLAQVGWGLILPYNAGPEIQEALAELLALRREQAGDRFKLFAGADGLGPRETKPEWLTRHGMGPGPADPAKVPYYLLLVGSPEEIPFTFQYQLNVQYAVGRIHFPKLEDYARYARSVVVAEKGKALLPRRCAFWAPSNGDDPSTLMSSTQLVRPVLSDLKKNMTGWEFTSFIGKKATKAQLVSLLGGDQTPALLFTASHGVEFPQDDERQIRHQGGLVSQEWPGPEEWRGKPIPQDFYTAGDDVGDQAQPLGLISFFFACYGAGTPKLDDFARQAFKERMAQAPYSFLASLPMRLLSHPRGGALAVVGHVDRAWGYSFAWPKVGEQTQVFRSSLRRLLRGVPIGHAMDYFDLRYAELAVDLSTQLEVISWNEAYAYDPYDMAGLWTAHNDARDYVILGDPAVRLSAPPEGEAAPATRDEIGAVVVPVVPAEGSGEQPERSTTPVLVPAEEPGPVVVARDPSFSMAVEGERRGLTESVKELAGKLTEALRNVAQDITSLEVKTYVSSDIASVKARSGKLEGELDLRAITLISFDGDMEVCVPEKGGAVDMELWQIHREMVREAQENRTRFLTAMAEMAVKLVDLFK